MDRFSEYRSSMTNILNKLSRRPSMTVALLALATACTSGMSLYFAAHRLDGYNYQLADYATIYVPQEAFSITGIESGKGSAKLQVTGDLGDGKLVGPPSSAMELVGGTLHVTGIPDGQHAFRITSEERPELRRDFSITCRSRATQVTSSSVLIGRFERMPLTELATQLDHYGPQDIQRARAKLSEHSVVAGNSTIDTLRNLWSWLFAEMGPTRGAPPDPDWLRHLPAYAQYTALTDGKAFGYCTHMAEVHNLFGTVAGLAMRVVDVNARLDGVNLANHTFNEIWIPEQERWAYSDLETGVLLVRESTSNRVVNAVEICQMMQIGATAPLIATTYDFNTKSFIDIPYEQASTGRLLHASATFVYHRYYANRGSIAAWLDRYLVNPELAYMMQERNSKHLAKMVTFGLLLACLFGWCLVAVRGLRRRRMRA